MCTITIIILGAPEIRDGFFTGGTTPGTIAGTARTDNPTSMPIIGDVTIVDDTSQLTDRVIIGCRAKGRPVPSITWRTMPPNLLNFTSPDYNVSFLPGQSILSVALAENDLTCVTYICNATNGLGSQEATRRICPQSKISYIYRYIYIKIDIDIYVCI